MDYNEWFCKRLSELRTQAHVSARDMRLSLGQCESYINRIENRRTMPSMTVFFYICEYFGITPEEFFNKDIAAPVAAKKIVSEFGQLTEKQAEHILAIIRDITQK